MKKLYSILSVALFLGVSLANLSHVHCMDEVGRERKLVEELIFSDKFDPFQVLTSTGEINEVPCFKVLRERVATKVFFVNANRGSLDELITRFKASWRPPSYQSKIFLSFMFCNLTDAAFSRVCEIIGRENIFFLYVNEMPDCRKRFTGKNLGICTHLSALCLRQCKFFMGPDWGQLSSLKGIRASRCRSLTGEYLNDLLGLRYLNVDLCEEFGPGLESIARIHKIKINRCKSTNLGEIEISGCGENYDPAWG